MLNKSSHLLKDIQEIWVKCEKQRPQFGHARAPGEARTHVRVTREWENRVNESARRAKWWEK